VAFAFAFDGRGAHGGDLGGGVAGLGVGLGIHRAPVSLPDIRVDRLLHRVIRRIPVLRLPLLLDLEGVLEVRRG